MCNFSFPLHVLEQFNPITHKIALTGSIRTRVWKGIFGIRDLTKRRCGNRENDKYIDRTQDLTVPGKRDSPKTGHGMRDLCLRVGRECRIP